MKRVKATKDSGFLGEKSYPHLTFWEIRGVTCQPKKKSVRECLWQNSTKRGEGVTNTERVFIKKEWLGTRCELYLLNVVHVILVTGCLSAWWTFKITFRCVSDHIMINCDYNSSPEVVHITILTHFARSQSKLEKWGKFSAFLEISGLEGYWYPDP